MAVAGTFVSAETSGRLIEELALFDLFFTGSVRRHLQPLVGEKPHMVFHPHVGGAFGGGAFGLVETFFSFPR